MEPATTQEDGAEASGSPPRPGAQRRGSPAPAGSPSPSRAPQMDPAPSPQRGKRDTTTGAAMEQSSRPKRARAADRNGEDEEEDAASRSAGEQEDSASAAAEQSASSSASSPLRCPCLPLLDARGNPKIDPAIFHAYYGEDEKYCAKMARQLKLATLDPNVPPSCLSGEDLLPVRKSAMNTVFQAAKVVVGLSSSIDGELLARCSGFFIEWDSETKVGTVLTSGCLICTKYPSIYDKSGAREYAPNAKVQVHLLDDTTVDGELLHYDNHYHMALFKVVVNLSADVIPCISSDVMHAQDVFLIGRDESLNLTASHGKVLYEGPGFFEPNHHMYVNCRVTKCGAGGPVIDFSGRFLGMANPTPREAFIPFSVIERCLHMWEKFNCIPRLHLGLKLSAISCMEPSHIEKISRKFKIDEGFIVQEVSEGSNAEKVGINIGDIIECWNGVCISTAIDLENMQLRICEDHLDSGNGLGSSVNLTVGVFRTRKETHCIKQLTVSVSDDVEVVARGTYIVSAREEPSALVSSDDVSPGKPKDVIGEIMSKRIDQSKVIRSSTGFIIGEGENYMDVLTCVYSRPCVQG